MNRFFHLRELYLRSRQRDRQLAVLIDALLPPGRYTGDLIVGGMATMPSRAGTFPYAIRSILRQVDKLYLYLDGFSDCPVVAQNSRVIPLFSRDFPKLHANGKLLGLALEKERCLYVAVDDDIYYFRNFVRLLRRALAMHHDAAVVGVHASLLARPLVRYNTNRRVFPYMSGLDQDMTVDIIATGASMFSSHALKFDVRKWPFTNMVDLGLALEATKARVPLIAVARKPGESLFTLEEDQEDSISKALKRDDTRQTELARELLRLRGESDQVPETTRF